MSDQKLSLTPNDLADRIERVIDPEHCNYAPAMDSDESGAAVPLIIGAFRASEWWKIIKALRHTPSERAERTGVTPKEGHCLLQVPQQTPDAPSPCAMAGYCLKTDDQHG